MSPEKLFHELLGLGDHWRVKELTYLKGGHGEVRIVIEDCPGLYENLSCSEDGADVRAYDHAPLRKWRHLNVFQHECYLECRLPRVKCSQCGKVRTLKGPWEGKIKGFTLLFEAFALTLIREMTVNAAARILGEYDTRLWRMLEAYVSEAYEQADFSEVKVVGCDELSARKGHNYLSVFADLKAKRVLYATDGKDASTWDRFAEELPKHKASASQIEQVSIDMSPAYQKGAKKNCPDAEIVFDHFHVMQNVGKAVDEVRRREHQSLSRKGDQSLKESMWLFRKNPENLNPEQTVHLDDLKQANLLTSKAYQMRLTLQDIYNITALEPFKRKLLVWCRWVKTYGKPKAYLFKPMVAVAESILKHLDGIIAYAESRITNAFMEGLNSVFSAVKRKARGYRSNKYLICMLYFVAGKLVIPDLL
jgi:transposase